MPRPGAEKALAAFPEVDFVNAYGLTETSSTIAVLGPAGHLPLAAGSDDEIVRARLGSVGQLVPGIEAEVRGGDGSAVGYRRTGRVVAARTPDLGGTYLGKATVAQRQRMVSPPRRARIDDEGYLFIEGRADDTMIRGGENIAPAEIEDVLIRHPAIRDAAVVGVPDEEWGERIVAAVVLYEDAAADTDEIRSFVRARLRGSRTRTTLSSETRCPTRPRESCCDGPRRCPVFPGGYPSHRKDVTERMQLKIGARYRSQVCQTEIIVIRPLPGGADLTCGGHPVIDLKETPAPAFRSRKARTQETPWASATPTPAGRWNCWSPNPVRAPWP